MNDPTRSSACDPVGELRTWREIPLAGEAAEPGHVTLDIQFPDPEGLLDTAYAFLRRLKSPPLKVAVRQVATSMVEEFVVRTGPGYCRVSAGDTEGIRRGLYKLAEFLRCHPPSELPQSEQRFTPKIKLRISRYRFGSPQHPVPLHELDEDADYFPEAFLDRYAQEGINAVWFNAPPFEALCITDLTPGSEEEKERKQAKLQRIVDQCRRYGIKVLPYWVTPQPWAFDAPILERYPDIAGPAECGRRYFCPAFKPGRQYLYDCMHQLFSSVRHLGGMLHIVYGEGASTCLNLLEYGPIPCNHKCGLSHGDIMRAEFDALLQGMREAAPGALMVAWFYLPFARKFPEWMEPVLVQAPKDIFFQMNAESGIEPVQLGRKRYCGDYWQCITELSPYYARFAETAGRNGHDASAKIQVGASHEVASVPYLPVPALTYRKYRRLAETGTRGAMQGWGAGGTPGLMNLAACRLSFTDFSTVSEDAFLLGLARTLWGEALAARIVRAWTQLSNAYTNYPFSNMVQYFGPVADGVVWPLYLYPRFHPLFPSWSLHEGQICGDNLCECLDNHSLDELVALFGSLSAEWDRGVAELLAIRQEHALNREQQLEVILAEAIGIHFGTAWRITRFYQLRGRLFAEKRPGVLDELRAIVEQDIAARRRMILLQEQDPRLGYNPEAGGYKYDRAKLERGIGFLEATLRDEFPRAKRDLLAGTLEPQLPCSAVYPLGSGRVDAGKFLWSAARMGDGLRIDVECLGHNRVLDELFVGLDDTGASFPWLGHMDSTGRVFTIPCASTCAIEPHADFWKVSISIPRQALPGGSFRHLRVNIVRLIDGYQTRCSWPGGAKEPLAARLNLVFYNPADMGLLVG